VEGFDVIEYPEGMPCWAPGAADYLEGKLQPYHNVWEWGGGASSRWLAERVRRLKVIETDGEWAEKIFDATKGLECLTEVCVIEMNDTKYLEVPKIALGSPDVWLIDGFRRIDCLAQLEKFATHDCIVVLDDALDYAEHLLDGPHKIRRFAQPHPHAGIPINHKKYGHLRNTVRKVHADTKETWVIHWTA
jgi:hypothetical protein